MPDGIGWLKKEINRKLLLAKVGCSNKKALKLLDDLLENDIPKLVNYYEKKN